MFIESYDTPKFFQLLLLLLVGYESQEEVSQSVLDLFRIEFATSHSPRVGLLHREVKQFTIDLTLKCGVTIARRN